MVSLFPFSSLALRALHSFPTRRSSDLSDLPLRRRLLYPTELPGRIYAGRYCRDIARRRYAPRSEEHTSELQSRGHLVCRLLLEKKNQSRVSSSDSTPSSATAHLPGGQS